MKIKDYISKSLQEYPSLCKDVDYEKSKIKILNRIFFTIGNGLEMADTVDPKQGGYVVDPAYKKDKHDEWQRQKDKPYGKEKYKPLPENFFEQDVYYVYGSTNRGKVLYRKDKYGEENIHFMFPKNEKQIFGPELYKAESLHEFHPYPFSKGFSIACDVFYQDLFLQEDWMQELIILCRRTLEFFLDENQIKNDVYYPDEKRVNRELRQFEESFKRDGVKGVRSLRKTWGFEVKDELPTQEEIQKKDDKSFAKYKKGQIDFLKKFLKKFDENRNQ